MSVNGASLSNEPAPRAGTLTIGRHSIDYRSLDNLWSQPSADA